MDMISKNMPIPEIVDRYPFLIDFFLKKGIKLMVCGDVLWGTLEEEVNRQGKSEELDSIIEEANQIIQEKGSSGRTYLDLGGRNDG
ncbi:hypothetical protein DU53_05360 [Kosmotoga sp. DU53]|nr:hypothetical protein DU53_05360 [Kosmotoga sp. DU53]